jgi:uncharacterized protein (DUF1501 family)
MLRIVHDDLCQGRLTRREWLWVGGFGLAAAARSAAANDATEVRPSAGFGKAKSVIFIFASGGQSQLEMWDPKPDAPLDVRGEFRPIATSAPGVVLGEHLPLVSRLADRFTIVRSMSHEDLDHGTAAYLALTGQYHALRSANPPPAANDLPTYGAVLARVRPSTRFVRTAVHVNGPALVPELPAPGQNGGLLGRRYEPLLIGDVSGGAFALPGLESRSELPPVRMSSRRSLKETLDRHAAAFDRRRTADFGQLYERGLEVLSSPTTRRAFNLEAEPEKTRDRYGRHRFGQACLLARRLAEAEAPFITVMCNHSNRGQDKSTDPEQFGWDTHNDIFVALKDHLLPRFDESCSALLEDLDARGLLSQTLVVCMGEFGRAPRVALEPKFAGATPGRKHWAAAYSIVLAGAGVSRGAVVGATDRVAGEVTTRRYGPWDAAATMFSALGVDPSGHYLDPLDRPYPISIGRPIEEAYA